jgi:hypothetical protein
LIHRRPGRVEGREAGQLALLLPPVPTRRRFGSCRLFMNAATRRARAGEREAGRAGMLRGSSEMGKGGGRSRCKNKPALWLWGRGARHFVTARGAEQDDDQHSRSPRCAALEAAVARGLPEVSSALAAPRAAAACLPAFFCFVRRSARRPGAAAGPPTTARPHSPRLSSFPPAGRKLT